MAKRAPSKTLKIKYRSRSGRRRCEAITSCFAAFDKAKRDPVDHACEGKKLADLLWKHAPGGTLEHMLLRLLGLMAAQPEHVTPASCKTIIRELQRELCAR